MATTTRTRNRKVDLSEGVTPDQEIKQLATTAYRHNLLANAEGNAYKKARISLYALMKKHSRKTFTFSDVNTKGDTIKLEASISTPESEKIDVTKLRALVSDEVFMKIVSASKEAVTKLVGDAVVRQCVFMATGEENVSIKPIK